MFGQSSDRQGPHPEVSPADALKIAAAQLKGVPPWSPFPVELMPLPVRDYVTDVAGGLRVEPAAVAVPMLAALGGIAGTKVFLNMDPEAAKAWIVRPIFWTVVVAASGSNKSAGWEAADDVAMRVEKELQDHNAFEQEGYEQRMQAWRDEDPEDRGPKPRQPELRQLLVDDTTVEAIASILADNPSGVILSTDELRNWFDCFTRYRKNGSGGDATRWLPFHSGKRFIVNRKGQGSKEASRTRLFVPHAAVSVMGTTQPKIFARIIGDEERDSGFLARLLMCMPPGRPRLWKPSTSKRSESRQVVEELAQRLHHLPEGQVVLAPAAVDRFVSWQNPWALESFKLSDAEQSAMRAKLEEVALRVALLYFLCDHSLEPRLPEQVPVGYVASGIATAEWFHTEALRVYASFIRSGPTTTAYRDAVRWAQEKTAAGNPLEGGFTARDVYRSRLKDTPEAAAALVNDMLEAKLIVEVPTEGKRGKPGPKLKKYLPAVRQVDKFDSADATDDEEGG